MKIFDRSGTPALYFDTFVCFGSDLTQKALNEKNLDISEAAIFAYMTPLQFSKHLLEGECTFFMAQKIMWGLDDMEEAADRKSSLDRFIRITEECRIEAEEGQRRVNEMHRHRHTR